LYNLPGGLFNKYSQPPTAPPTANNMPYYAQPDTTGIHNIKILQPRFPHKSYYKYLFTGKKPIDNIPQQQQTSNGGVNNMNSYGSQYNNNIRVAPQQAEIQNYFLNSLVDAVTIAIRSNVPYPFLVDNPQLKEYIQQVIVIVEIMYKTQVKEKCYQRTFLNTFN